jgi:hypothetical protein
VRSGADVWKGAQNSGIIQGEQREEKSGNEAISSSDAHSSRLRRRKQGQEEMFTDGWAPEKAAAVASQEPGRTRDTSPSQKTTSDGGKEAAGEAKGAEAARGQLVSLSPHVASR